MLAACWCRPSCTERAAATVAPATSDAASCIPANTGSSIVPRPWSTSGCTDVLARSGLPLSECPRTVARGLERREQRSTHAMVLELADRGDRRAARAGDGFAQLHGMLAGVAQHDRRADRGLHDEVGGNRARK